MMKPLFIDIETTGLDPHSHEILEVAAIETDEELNERRVYEVKIRPVHINTASPKALEVNRYNEAEWSGASALRPALLNLLPYLEGATVFGHNVNFDWRFIRHNLNLCHIPLPPMNSTLIDTMSIADMLIKEGHYQGKRSLTTLCQNLGIINSQPHRALGDARACLDFVRYARNRRRYAHSTL